jgi:hypothetical protein
MIISLSLGYALITLGVCLWSLVVIVKLINYILL